MDKFSKGKYPGDILNQLNADSGVGSLMVHNKYTVRGAIFGFIGGFVVSSYLRKNKFVGILIGTLIGGGSGRLYSDLVIKSNKNQKDEVDSKSDL